MCCRRGLDVDEVMVDAAADWKPVDKPPEAKDEDGNIVLNMCLSMCICSTCVCQINQYY